MEVGPQQIRYLPLSKPWGQSAIVDCPPFYFQNIQKVLKYKKGEFNQNLKRL